MQFCPSYSAATRTAYGTPTRSNHVQYWYTIPPLLYSALVLTKLGVQYACFSLSSCAVALGLHDHVHQ